MKSPFKFLDAYTVRDKHVFFGRDTEIETLYSLVFKANLHVVYGLSGTGKTSLIQCGLASKFDGPDWYPMFIRRNENLNASIKFAIGKALGSVATGDLVSDVSNLMRKTLRPVYLIMDQFEELFILGTKKEQETFIQDLRKLLDAGLNTKVILVMREEYIGQLYSFEQTIPELFDFRFRVEPMGITKVQSVIQESFEKFNVHLEEPRQEMLQFMTDQISDPKAGIALPYLQVYLDMLYRDAYRRKFGKQDAPQELPSLDITKKDIAGLGKIGNVLEKFLTRQIKELTEILQQEIRTFPANGIQLILDPFATAEGTKRPVHYEREQENIALDAEVSNAMPDLPEGSLSRAIELLEQARILRVREDTIELAHDSLAKIIDDKRTDEQRQLQNVRRRLANAFDEFQKTGLYLNEKQLAAFEVFVPDLNLSEELQKFIQDSVLDVQREADAERKRQLQEQEVKQQKRLARVRGILLGVVAIFAGAAVFYAARSHKQIGINNVTIERLDSLVAVQQAQQDTLKLKQDTLQNIITQVGQQVFLFDSLISKNKRIPRGEVMKSVLTLKTLIADKTASKKELDNCAWLRDSTIVLSTESTGYGTPASSGYGTPASSGYGTPAPSGYGIPAVGQHEFKVGEKIYAYALTRTKKDEELLQVSWFDVDGKIVGTPEYVEVKKPNTDVTIRSAYTFSKSGTYSVRIDNGLGIQIGSATFVVQDANADESKLSIKDGNFRIVTSVINGKPGKEVTKFKSGSTVYYWGRINCPKDKALVIVTVEDASKYVIWEKKHDIALNTRDGYLIWSAKGFNGNGTYTVRVKNELGEELAQAEFMME